MLKEAAGSMKSGNRSSVEDGSGKWDGGWKQS